MSCIYFIWTNEKKERYFHCIARADVRLCRLANYGNLLKLIINHEMPGEISINLHTSNSNRSPIDDLKSCPGAIEKYNQMFDDVTNFDIDIDIYWRWAGSDWIRSEHRPVMAH